MNWCPAPLKARQSRNSSMGNSLLSPASAASLTSLSKGALGCPTKRGNQVAVATDLSHVARCLGLAVHVGPKAEPGSSLKTDRGSRSLNSHAHSPIRGWLNRETPSFGWWRTPLWKKFKKSLQNTYSQTRLYSKLKWWVYRKSNCSWKLSRI